MDRALDLVATSLECLSGRGSTISWHLRSLCGVGTSLESTDKKRKGVSSPAQMDFLPPSCWRRSWVPFIGFSKLHFKLYQVSVAKVGFVSLIACFEMRNEICLHVLKIICHCLKKVKN